MRCSLGESLLGWRGRYRPGTPAPAEGSGLRPGVTVVVPTWNGADLLEACLACVQSQDLTPARIVVVDNASTDSTLSVVKQFAGVEVMRMQTNEGYSGALARVVASLNTEYVAPLNNDAQPDPRWLSVLTRHLEAHARTGCAFPMVVRTDGLVDTGGDILTIAGFAYKHWFRSPPPIVLPSSKWFVSAPGVAPVYRVRAIHSVGGWDAGLHSQWDDIDMGLKLWEAGWDLDAVHSVRVVHRQGASAGRDIRGRDFLAARNETVVLLTHLPAATLVALLPHRLVYLTLSMLSHMVRGTAPAYIAGHLAAVASVGAILAVRRSLRPVRRLTSGELNSGWLPVWWGLSRMGGRQAPRSS